MSPNCSCTPEEIKAGHRRDCPLNKELAPKPVAPRKPFEEMSRDEMIVAHAALRADVASYVSQLHEICRAGIGLARLTAPLVEYSEELAAARDRLTELLEMTEEEKREGSFKLRLLSTLKKIMGQRE